jgi:DNA-binding NarL/FixJ family response regulator
MENSFLLISDQTRTAWNEVPGDILSSLGSLQVVTEEEINPEILRTHFDLIIMDAAAIKDPAQLVSRLRSLNPGIRIVVASVTPTWQEARAVLRAGAADYFSRPVNQDELFSTMQETLRRLGPSAPS